MRRLGWVLTWLLLALALLALILDNTNDATPIRPQPHVTEVTQ